MKSNSSLPSLTEKQEFDIVELAKQQRNSLGSDDAPIANDLLLLLEKKHITLVQYPIEDDGTRSFGAIFLTTKDADIDFNFIGLNTNDYYDKQIFSIAHELYHYAKKDQWHISRDDEDKSGDFTELLADKFAAEFILPLHTFKKIVVSEFDKSELFDLQLSTILRFIARIHCTWWLPYKSIVRRLLEAGSINQEIYNRLYQIEERRPDGEYYKIGLTTNEHDFKMLNDITRKVGTGAADLEILVRNYEDGIISESQLADDLLLFGKTPEDFGVAFEIDEEDAVELNELFAEGAKNGC